MGILREKKEPTLQRRFGPGCLFRNQGFISTISLHNYGDSGNSEEGPEPWKDSSPHAQFQTKPPIEGSLTAISAFEHRPCFFSATKTWVNRFPLA